MIPTSLSVFQTESQLDNMSYTELEAGYKGLLGIYEFLNNNELSMMTQYTQARVRVCHPVLRFYSSLLDNVLLVSAAYSNFALRFSL